MNAWKNALRHCLFNGLPISIPLSLSLSILLLELFSINSELSSVLNFFFDREWVSLLLPFRIYLWIIRHFSYCTHTMMYLHLGLSYALIETTRKNYIFRRIFDIFMLLFLRVKCKKNIAFCHFTFSACAELGGFLSLSCLPHLIIIDTFLIFFIVGLLIFVCYPNE